MGSPKGSDNDMTKYNQVQSYKTTEFYNITPTHYFLIFDMRSNKHSLCFKVTDNSYVNTETNEYIKLKSDDLDMMVKSVNAKVNPDYVEIIRRFRSYKEIKNMANREILIKIPEDKYDRLMQQIRLDRNFNACEIIELGEHGRIIDEEKINKCEKTGLIIKDDSVIRCFTTDAPTIIEAHHPVSVKKQSQDRDDNLER